jgi:arsenite methyltransferase
MSVNEIHETVRERYSTIARSVGPEAASCCGSSDESGSCGCSNGLYNVALLEGLPDEVVNLSLGCGDPITIAELKPGEVVVDLGSGGGIDCFMAARQVGDTGHVVGVDMTPAMLEKANANKAKLNATNVEFRQGQIEALPVDSDTVDVIMSNCVINLSPDKPAVFAEAFRVLKPGGRIAVSDIVTEGDFSDDIRADTAKWAECVTGAIDVTLYTAMMAAAGFVDIAVIDKTGAEGIVDQQPGMPRIYSARVTATKPE